MAVEAAGRRQSATPGTKTMVILLTIISAALNRLRDPPEYSLVLPSFHLTTIFRVNTRVLQQLTPQVASKIVLKEGLDSVGIFRIKWFPLTLFSTHSKFH